MLQSLLDRFRLMMGVIGDAWVDPPTAGDNAERLGIKIILPIMLKTGAEIMFFETIIEAERYIEPGYIDAHERVYDASGRLYRMYSGPAGLTIIEPAETEPTHAAELRAALIYFFEIATDIPTYQLTSLSLAALIDMGVRRAGYTR
jgi:hypothetical protein